MLAMILAVTMAMDEVRPPEVFAGNAELRAYMTEAAEHHPALRAQYARWKAALEQKAQMTALDDPRFEYGQFLQSEMNRFTAMVAQEFPWFGVRKARGAMALAEAEAMLGELYAMRNALFVEVKTAYHEYAYLRRRIEVIEAQQQLLTFMEETILERYSLAMAPESDLLRIQIRASEVENGRREAEAMRAVLSARLREAIGRSAGELLPWPQDAALPPPPPPAAAVLARLRTNNPAVAVFDRLAERERLGGELARLAGFPNFMIGVEYMGVSKPRQMGTNGVVMPGAAMAARNALGMASGVMEFEPVGFGLELADVNNQLNPPEISDGGEDEVKLTLGFSLPIYRKKYRAARAEARYREEAAEFDKEARILQLDRAASEALFAFDDAVRRLALYRDELQPQAESTMASVQSAYSAGIAESGVIDVLESADTILAFELERERAYRDLHLAAAQLEYLMGGPWSGDGASEPMPALEAGDAEEGSVETTVLPPMNGMDMR